MFKYLLYVFILQLFKILNYNTEGRFILWRYASIMHVKCIKLFMQRQEIHAVYSLCRGKRGKLSGGISWPRGDFQSACELWWCPGCRCLFLCCVLYTRPALDSCTSGKRQKTPKWLLLNMHDYANWRSQWYLAQVYGSRKSFDTKTMQNVEILWIIQWLFAFVHFIYCPLVVLWGFLCAWTATQSGAFPALASPVN